MAQEKSSGGEEIRCSACNFTQADFKKAGRLGCAKCYDTFAEGLEGLLKSMHKGTRHVGKRHMLYNGANPRIEIDPRTVEIRIDGEPVPLLPDDDLPLNRRYLLL